MEDPSAQFVSMVMDRLHALEDKNLVLEEQNTQLAARLSTMEACLKDDLMTFCDGQV